MVDYIGQRNPFGKAASKHPVVSTTMTVFVVVAAFIISALSALFPARAAEPTKQAIELAAVSLVRPNDVNSGSLLLPSKREGFYVEAPRLATSVNIDISGPIARATVIQKFENPSKGWIEGIYVFPLPDDSAVDVLKMKIGDRVIEGLIKPRAKAREIYEQAKRDGKKAALLEQQRPNIFSNAVANIGPGETIIVQIEYQQTIKQDAGTFSLRFPMVVAPRYSPKPIIKSVDFKPGRSGWGNSDPVPDREKITPPVLDPSKNAKINPVQLTVRLAAGFPLDSVISHYHKIDSKEVDETLRTISLTGKEVPADKDFELSWTAKGTAPTAALLQEKVGNKNYILAMITPPKLTPEQLAQIANKSREIIFVVDNSGSMSGQSIAQARLSLETALKRLKPKDHFNIVRFNNTHEMVFPTAVPADRENLDIALSFVRNLQAQGGTEMLGALRLALNDATPNSTDRVRQVVFITDGAIGNENQLFQAIKANLGRSRVFTIGIGSAPNSFFMNRAARIGRGTATHIGDIAQVSKRMGALFKKLENPVLTGLRAVVSGGVLSEVTPDPLPDLYLGEPIILSAEMAKVSGRLILEGDYAGTPWQYNLGLAQATIGSGVGKYWARRKIASLESDLASTGDTVSIDRQIEQTALDHHLVSRLTSLVAVDVTKSRPKNEKLDSKNLAVNLPDGWDFDKVFGDSEAKPTAYPKKQRAMPRVKRRASLQGGRTSRTRGLQVAAIAAAPAQESAADTSSRSYRVASAQTKRRVILPRTASPADRHIILGFLFLILAAMIWVTGKMWRGTGKTALAGAKRRPGNFDLLP